jgi:hypothetical protein
MTSTQIVEPINVIAPIVATNKQDMTEVFFIDMRSTSEILKPKISNKFLQNMY